MSSGEMLRAIQSASQSSKLNGNEPVVMLETALLAGARFGSRFVTRSGAEFLPPAGWVHLKQGNLDDWEATMQTPLASIMLNDTPFKGTAIGFAQRGIPVAPGTIRNVHLCGGYPALYYQFYFNVDNVDKVGEAIVTIWHGNAVQALFTNISGGSGQNASGEAALATLCPRQSASTQTSRQASARNANSADTTLAGPFAAFPGLTFRPPLGGVLLFHANNNYVWKWNMSSGDAEYLRVHQDDDSPDPLPAFAQRHMEQYLQVVKGAILAGPQSILVCGDHSAILYAVEAHSLSRPFHDDIVYTSWRGVGYEVDYGRYETDVELAGIGQSIRSLCPHRPYQP